jgi:hypothetical protein
MEVNSDTTIMSERYLIACDGNRTEAKRRWDVTQQWRQHEEVDAILQSCPLHFHIIRENLPLYHAGHGFLGHIVYYTRVTGNDSYQYMRDQGVRMEDIWRYWLFFTEYRWKILVPDDMGQCISVVDVEHIAITDIAGEKLEFLRKILPIAGAHYPGRPFIILIINVPSWFSFILQLIYPFIAEQIKKQIRILTKDKVLQG